MCSTSALPSFPMSAKHASGSCMPIHGRLDCKLHIAPLSPMASAIRGITLKAVTTGAGLGHARLHLDVVKAGRQCIDARHAALHCCDLALIKQRRQLRQHGGQRPHRCPPGITIVLTHWLFLPLQVSAFCCRCICFYSSGTSSDKIDVLCIATLATDLAVKCASEIKQSAATHQTPTMRNAVVLSCIKEDKA